MKKVMMLIWSSIFFLLLLSISSKAQIGMLGYGENVRKGVFNGGFGITSIDDQTYYTITFHPEIALGKFGLGLNVDLLYNTETGHIRKKDWNESYDYFRMIRYIRYGWKGDNFYSRLGTLDAARLGHGFIMNYYTNEAEWDERKIGLALDVNFGMYGFESVTSNMGRLEIIGSRVYVRPLRKSVQIPIIRDLTFGATYVTDVDPDKNRDTTEDRVSVYGGDVELPFIDSKILWSGIYGDYAKINNYGSGKAVGFGIQFKNLLGLLRLEARVERRWLGKEFIPSYFDAFYEIDRYTPLSPQTGISKKEMLATITEKTKGYFGELYGNLLGTIHLIGHFQRLDDQPKSGVLHLQANAPNTIPSIALQASYDKKNIETFKDIRTLDNRSVARLSVGYKIKPYLILYMDYIWSFVFDEDINKYVPQERYQPRVAFNYNFSL